MVKKELNTVQYDRLVNFASSYGSDWRNILLTMWQRGADCREPDGHILRQIRNNFGPSWLATFCL